jgi:glycosyltransferase involved in cell wall biosynthesis
MKVCMLAYTLYEFDNRVMRYAETLVNQGDRVDVIALRQDNGPVYEAIRGVNVYRVQRRIFNEKGRLSYLSKILRFFFHSMVFLSKKCLEKQYDVIHVHNVPDFLVYTGWLAKLTGAKIILDIHDILPEFYASKFKQEKDSIVFKLLVFLERSSIAFADHVIISNHLWQKTLIERSIPKEKITVILNYPDPSIFHPRARTRKDDRFIMMYPGSVNWHQGLDIAIKACSIIKDQVPQAEFHIHGGNSARRILGPLVSELSLEKEVLFKDTLPIYRMAEVMGEADLAIVPKRAVRFGNEAFSTKILEFMALGVPLIVSETKVDRYYFGDNLVEFFKSEDEADLARCMLRLIQHQKRRATLALNALEFARDYTWDKKKEDYLKLLNRLTEHGAAEGREAKALLAARHAP